VSDTATTGGRGVDCRHAKKVGTALAVAGLDFLLPRTRFGRTLLLAGIALAALAGLGSLGARLGPVLFRPLDWHWLLLLGAGAFLAPASSSTRAPLARQAAAAVALALLGWPVLSWIGALGRATSPLPATVERLSRQAGAAAVELSSLELPGRKYLARLAGRRRDVSLSTEGFLRAPEPGTYRFDLDCDDRCTLSLDGRALANAAGPASASVDLAAGVHRFFLQYEQTGGPARLEIAWDRPAFFEPLGLEHHVAARSGPLAPALLRRRALLATAGLALALAWWTLVLGLIIRVGELRREWVGFFAVHPAGRFVPVLAAVAVMLYGSLLRVRALEAWAGLSREAMNERWTIVLPDYGAFDPPEDPSVVYRADVRSYLDRAATLSASRFYEPHFREPFYVILVQVFLALSGGREVGILLQSTCFSILTLPLVFWLASRSVGRWVALAVLVPLAVHEWLIQEAPTGYRESAYSFFLLAFAGWVFSGRQERLPLRAVVAGLIGAMVCLIRLSGLTFVLPLLGLWGWEQRREAGWRYAAIALIVLGLGIGPFLWNCYRVHGDPFYSVSFHTRFWLDGERPSEVAPPVGVFRYLFEFHGLEDLLGGTLLGLTVLPLHTFWNGLAHYPLLDAAVLVFGVAGLFLSFFRGPRFLPVAYFGHLLPFAYIQNFPSGEMPRFVVPAYFFLVLAAGQSLRKLLETWREKRV